MHNWLKLITLVLVGHELTSEINPEDIIQEFKQ